MRLHPQAALLIGVVAAVTLLLRLLPFAVFSGKRQAPAIVTYLGNVLPCAIMGMLVVYCLKDVRITAAPHGLPEAAAVAAVAGLHVWKRNTLLSICGGTLLYMLLVQTVFA